MHAAAARAVSALTVLTRLMGLAATAIAAATALAALAAVSGAASAAALQIHDLGYSGVQPSAVRVQGMRGAHRRGDRADPGCRVHIGDVRLVAYRKHGSVIHAAGVDANVTCGLPVHRMSLQVTLWKAGLLYDHQQAQTTVRAAAGSYLGSYLTRATCKDQTTSGFYGVAHAVVYFGGKRGDAWVKSPGTSTPRCGT